MDPPWIALDGLPERKVEIVWGSADLPTGTALRVATSVARAFLHVLGAPQLEDGLPLWVTSHRATLLSNVKHLLQAVRPHVLRREIGPLPLQGMGAAKGGVG
jgi:hypothetical protein